MNVVDAESDMMTLWRVFTCMKWIVFLVVARTESIFRIVTRSRLRNLVDIHLRIPQLCRLVRTQNRESTRLATIHPRLA